MVVEQPAYRKRRSRPWHLIFTATASISLIATLSGSARNSFCRGYNSDVCSYADYASCFQGCRSVAHGTRRHSRFLSSVQLKASIEEAELEPLRPRLEGPLTIMELPDRFIGGDYIVLQLLVDDGRENSTLRLLLDSGFTAPVMLTADACHRLNLPTDVDGSELAPSIGATGSSLSMQPVRLDRASLMIDSGNGAISQSGLPLMSMTGVIVQDFPQFRIGKEVGSPIDGMLGQGFMTQFDLEFDVKEKVLRAWEVGGLPKGNHKGGWRLLETLPMPGQLQGLLLSVPGCFEPVVGIVDSGASHTVLNRKAAYVLGVEASSSLSQDDGRKVRGIGLDGTSLEMPLLTLANVTLSGARHVTIEPSRPGKGKRKTWRFRNTGAIRQSSRAAHTTDPIDVAVGDIGFFEELLSQPQDTIGGFDGPVALLGQDILTQLPMRYSASTNKIWFKQE